MTILGDHFARFGRAAGRRHWLAALAIGVATISTLLPAPVWAQEGDNGLELVAPDAAGDQLQLDVGTGRVLKLTRPVASIFVADPEIADVQAYSPTLVYLFAKATGTTSVFGVDAGEELILRRNVVVTHALEALRQALQDAAPNSDVEVKSIGGGLILSGYVDQPDTAYNLVNIAQSFLGEEETIVNNLEIGGSVQVNLRVRVAEMSREVTRVFGVSLDSALEVGDTFFSFLSGRSFLSDDRGTFSRLIDNSGPAGTVLGSYTGDDFAIDGIIDALEREGLASVLAEPNLTALSGETASFLAGGEFPIPIGADGNDIQIEFREFGVSLAFTPTVLSRNRISLNVRPEISDLDFTNAVELAGVTVPALRTRRAETTIELGSGQSFAIGGLISSDVSANVEKFPGLGDVPILGPLFRSTDFARSETELVIIVTPYLVKPTHPDRLAMPGESFRPASDLERILNGRLQNHSVAIGAGAPRLAQQGRLQGPAGFIIE